VKIPVSDGEISGYRAQPKSGGSFPVVLVACEIFGLQEHIKDICRRFADEGYLAIAPDFFCRQGDVSKLEDFDAIIKIISQVPDAQVMSDLDAAVEWAAKHKGDAKKLESRGSAGRSCNMAVFCSQSESQSRHRMVWTARRRSTNLQPKHPIDIVPMLKAPVLGLYGGKDQGIPLDTVEKMREALKKTGNPSEIIVYPDAPHGFFADTRESYRKEAAQDGWKRLLAWFKKNGA